MTFNAEILLRDGAPAYIRNIEDKDREELSTLFKELNNAALNFRFFKQARLPDDEQIRGLGQPNHDSSSHRALIICCKGPEGEMIGGVGRYYRDDNRDNKAVETATVAIAVRRDHQGRGIGTALLETLAREARAEGIHKFRAEVLGEENYVLRMAANSGLGVTSTAEAGMVHLSLSTKQTDELTASSLAREIHASANSIAQIMEPESVAVIGASREEGSIGGGLLYNILSFGFKGKVYPVNPKADEIQGLKAYPSILDIKEPVQVAVVVVPGRFVEGVVKQCAEAGVKAIVVISAGFAEVSKDGRKKEEELTQFVRRSGMRMVGPNCMGIFNTDPKYMLNATFAPGVPRKGNVGFLSQSGALGVAILDYARILNIGVSTFISVGNKPDVSGNDMLCYWAEDPNTDVIALYLESFGNPRKFAQIAPQVARNKPIVAVKSGRTASGSRAAQSHSAALSSLDVAVEALFKQAGVVRTDTLEGLFDVISLFSTQPIPEGKRVGVVTNAGGPGILLADALEANGLELPTLTDKSIAALKEFLPAEAGYTNPIDMIASANPDDYSRAMEIIGNDDNVDVLVVIFVPPRPSAHFEVGAGIAKGAGLVPSNKPIATVYLSSKGAPEVLSQGPRGHIPSYAFPENAARAMTAAVQYGEWRKRPQGKAHTLDRFRKELIRSVVDRNLSELSGEDAVWIKQKDLEVMLQAVGIEVAASETCSISEAPEIAERLDFPLVAKAISPSVLHKSDVGGVILNIKNQDDLKAALKTLEDNMAAINAPLEGVLLQRQVSDGHEGFVGVTTDETFGPLVVCGLGGVQVELLKDVSFRLPPVTDVDAKEMLDALRSKKLLEGYRGAPAGDTDAFENVLQRISSLVELVPEIAELDLNPVKILAPGRGAVAVDGRMRLKRL